MTAARTLRGVWLGRRPYAPVHALQERLRAERGRGEIPDTVLFLEHTPVVTLGRGADRSNVLLSDEALAARGFDVEKTDRGGDVTLHAPGQLVAYPIIDLNPDRRDVRRYVRDLTETMRRVAFRHGIAAGEVPGMIGLWVDRASPGTWSGPDRARDLSKLGAIGVRISQWVTMHGFALNLSTEVDLFQLIVPCGIQKYGVTSLAELGVPGLVMKTEADAAYDVLADVFGFERAALDDRSSTEL